MFSVRGRVIFAESGEACLTVQHAVACSGCAGCRTVERLVRIPGVWEKQTELTLSMSTGDGIKLLIQSLVLPLFGFVSGALAASSLELGEPMVIGGALLGLMTGMVLCRKQSFNKIHIDRG